MLLLVVKGRANITYADGTIVQLALEDLVTVVPEIRGSWKIVESVFIRFTCDDNTVLGAQVVLAEAARSRIFPPIDKQLDIASFRVKTNEL
jgi:hypothetical protein